MITNEIVKKQSSCGDILEQLSQHLDQPNPEYPQEIIDQIVQQKELITPELLKMLEQFVENPPTIYSLMPKIRCLDLSKFFLLR